MFVGFAYSEMVHQFVKFAASSDKDIFLYSVGQEDKQLIETLPKFRKSFFGLAITPLALDTVLILTGCICQTAYSKNRC